MRSRLHDAMRSLKEEFSKVTKKLSDQERTIKSLKLSNATQKQKLAELGDGAGTVAVTKKKGMSKQGSFGSRPLRDHDEWALTGDGGFMPVETSNLKGFISMQFREELEGTEPILVIDDPNSTTGGTKKKKKRRLARGLKRVIKTRMLQMYWHGHKDHHKNVVVLAVTEVQCTGTSRHHLRVSTVKKKVVMK